MKDLYETINEGALEYNDKDFKKFKKDYEKFLDSIKDEKLGEKVQHAVDQMAEWFKDLKRHDGLPMSYGRYEQFTYAFVTFDASQRDGAGGLYDKDTTDSLTKFWEKATGYKIVNQYK